MPTPAALPDTPGPSASDSADRIRPLRIVISGGTGQVGAVLARHWRAAGHSVVVLSRSGADGTVPWDGATLGPWVSQIDGADAVVNLAGRTVNCRYTAQNLHEMLASRVDSTRAVGEAIGAVRNPPSLWLQMSTATIYAHRFDAPNDELTGQLGGQEPDAPAYWARSVAIARAWEAALDAADTPGTRRIALRTAMVMSPDAGGVFDMLRRLCRAGLGGTIGGGRQYVSWIHGEDFCRALDFLIEHTELAGPVNLAAPNPVPQGEHMRTLRRALGVPIGLPATAGMATLGAVFLRTDAELVLKSRRVVPRRLLEAGFRFRYPTWGEAATELAAQRS